MRVLLDTNMMIRLGTAASLSSDLERVLDDSQIYVTVIARAEIGIKIAIGKLQLPADEAFFWRTLVDRLQAEEISFDSNHAAHLSSMPLHHRDPFDRMIAAQCLSEGLTLATTDAIFKLYGVNVLA